MLSIFMTHVRSAFIWEAIPILRFTQFPWRFLAVAMFAVSLLAALFIQNLPKGMQKYISVILVGLTITLNWNYFQPQVVYPNITDGQKLSGDLWETQQKAAILDYLPKTAVMPREKAPSDPILRSGEVEISNFILKSNSWKLKADVKTSSEIEIPVLDFPNWRVWVNGKSFTYSNDDYLGRISLKLNRGSYLIEGKFKDTIIRTISNLITVVSLVVVVIVFIIYGKSGKKII